MVQVEYTIEEAEALVKRLAPDPHPSLSAAECDAVGTAFSKLTLAVQIERGPGGAHFEDTDGAMERMLATAESLIGRRVRVATTYGATYTGRLTKMGGFRSLIIDDGRFTTPVNVSLVETLEAERAAA